MIRVKASGDEYAKLVYEATNEDPWGPTGEQMDNVCRVFLAGTVKIMEEIKLRLKNRDKSWRTCYKALLLLDHLARNVPEAGLPSLCSILPILQQISQTFYSTGKHGEDHGLSVRERSKKLYDLLSDATTLRDERFKAAATRAKLGGEPIGGAGYGGFGSSQFQSLSGDEQPPGTFQQTFTTNRTVSREQQEQEDRELAARMQREEERSAGITVYEAQRMMGLEKRGKESKEASEKADMELAKRLEEEERRQAAGEATSTLSEVRATAPSTGSVSPNPVEAPSKPEAPRHDMLDDLFAPVPSAPVTATAPSGTFSAPAQQHVPPQDPFGGFTDANAHQQPQWPQQQPQMQQQWPQQQQQWSQPQPQMQQQWPQQQQQWSQQQPQMQQQWPQQHQQWPQPEPSAQPPYGASQPLATPMQVPSGMPSGAGWLNTPAPAQQVQPPVSQMMPGVQSGMWSSGAPQGMTGMGVSGSQAFVPFNMGAGITQPNMMEQQIAQFSGQSSGFVQPAPVSLDGIIAGRRFGQ